MRNLIFLMVVSACLAATCPNLCSGHGTCTKSGTCSCYKGYTFGDCSGKVCPYGKTYVEPEASTTGNDKHTDLECSGKGNCNRESGLCECFDGFEGSACQRLSCPNSCSGHGLCVPVQHLSLDAKSDGSAQYGNVYNPTAYGKWDVDQSYACVCDGEYSGYDCSEKKCPSGYTATSDCESSSSTSTEVIELGSTSPGNACLAYLEYTDNYGRKWYTDKLCLTKITEGGWNDALKRLPVGVIDPDTKVEIDSTNNKVTITFGSQQTGRKPQIKVISKKDLEDKKDLYPGATTPSGYHGMSTSDLVKDNTNDLYTGTASYTYSGVKAIECGGNGSCNTETGLCECFTGFYGIACTMTEDMM